MILTIQQPGRKTVQDFVLDPDTVPWHRAHASFHYPPDIRGNSPQIAMPAIVGLARS